MTDDLAYVRERIPDYREYGEESARHDSDMRVRAYLGERLSETQTRLDPALDEAARKTLEDVLMRCMFSDQVFIRKFEHARLDGPMVAALVHSDRRLVELGDGLASVDASTVRDALVEIDKQFEYRRAPDPLTERAD